jgi:hypothetical protein
LEIVDDGKPTTVRRVFYQGTVRGLVAKTEQSYGIVKNDLTVMRRARVLPYDRLADNTHWQRRHNTFSGIEAALKDTAAFYRKSLWDDADSYVENECRTDGRQPTGGPQPRSSFVAFLSSLITISGQAVNEILNHFTFALLCRFEHSKLFRRQVPLDSIADDLAQLIGFDSVEFNADIGAESFGATVGGVCGARRQSPLCHVCEDTGLEFIRTIHRNELRAETASREVNSMDLLTKLVNEAVQGGRYPAADRIVRAVELLKRCQCELKTSPSIYRGRMI